MGWFSSSKPEEPTAVTRGARQQCWDARDAYFACLDARGVLKAGDEAGACASQEVTYGENCAKSWVRACALRWWVGSADGRVRQIDYFNQRRILAERQKGMLAQAATQAQEAKRR
jgi:cytochrome c oxidase assembly factor 6